MPKPIVAELWTFVLTAEHFYTANSSRLRNELQRIAQDYKTMSGEQATAEELKELFPENETRQVWALNVQLVNQIVL